MLEDTSNTGKFKVQVKTILPHLTILAKITYLV